MIAFSFRLNVLRLSSVRPDSRTSSSLQRSDCRRVSYCGRFPVAVCIEKNQPRRHTWRHHAHSDMPLLFKLSDMAVIGPLTMARVCHGLEIVGSAKNSVVVQQMVTAPWFPTLLARSLYYIGEAPSHWHIIGAVWFNVWFFWRAPSLVFSNQWEHYLSRINHLQAFVWLSCHVHLY